MVFLKVSTLTLVKDMITGTKTTTIRRNACRWNEIWLRAEVGDRIPLLHIYYSPLSWRQEGYKGSLQRIGVRELHQVVLKRGSWLNTEDAQRDGFPTVEALTKALAALNGMTEEQVMSHVWAVLHMGRWVEPPDHPVEVDEL